MYIDLFLDWLDDNKIRFYLSKQISIQSINKKRIFSQAIKLMPMEKVVNDVRVLCKDKFVLEDESEHNVRQKLSKLVKVFRRDHERSKKKKAKVDKNLSRTKNILVTPCGLRHRDLTNAMQRRQRRKKREQLTAPVWF